MAEPRPLILVVEDQKDLASLISTQLETSGMVCQVAYTADAAFRFLKRNHVNLMLLDINLPDRSGTDLLDDLVNDDLKVPTIFLTAYDSESQIVQGLTRGGDDYITKPFSFPELVARIRAVLRRTETAADHHITKNAQISQEAFLFCGASVNPLRLELIFPNETVIKIGRKELGIMAFLVSNEGKVITRKALIHGVWGVHADVKSRSLDQYIVKIRDHYVKNGLTLGAFRTIHGVGYIYDPTGPDEDE
jgi:DNA-binding response OmpR family regulator